MQKIQWKGRPFKALSFGKSLKKAGRNFSGRITIFHRGGGSKKLYRRIDYERRIAAKGLIERIEYDPNRTARIALVRWFEFKLENSANSGLRRFCSHSNSWDLKQIQPQNLSIRHPSIPFQLLTLRPSNLDSPIKTLSSIVENETAKRNQFSSFVKESKAPSKVSNKSTDLYYVPKLAFSYILAWNDIQPGDEVFNLEVIQKCDRQVPLSNEKSSIQELQNSKSNEMFSNELIHFNQEQSTKKASIKQLSLYTTYLGQKKGASMSLQSVPIGSIIHNIELQPGKGGQLVRAAGTSAQLVKKEESSSTGSSREVLPRKEIHSSSCLIRLPSGQQQLLDSRCRVTIGTVSNVDHGIQRLRKAGQRRWLGFRPIVRGVAMNPIDHPHGGGEGRTKGGRPSVSPWGKPSKCGFGSKRKLRQLKR